MNARAGCTASVPMQVVRVRHVGMPMSQRLVDMPMAVFARWHGIVHVLVMTIVMAVGMFVSQRFVRMLVAM